MMKRCMAGALVVVAVAGGTFAQSEAPPLPTQEQLKGLMEKGDWREALRGISRVLELKGVAAQPYERYTLLMMRAECQLQLRENKAALDALALAQKEAVAKEKPDDVSAALAMTYLIQKSPMMKYSPKTSTGPLAKKPIDILDRAARPEAFKALYADELSAVRTKVRAAENARTLPPILEAAKQAATLSGIEQVATGDRKETQEMSRTLATNAAVLLQSAVNEQAQKVDTLYKAANTVIVRPINRYDPVTRQSWVEQASFLRGVTNEDAAALKGIQQFCGQAIGACSDLALGMPAHADTFKEIATSATTVRNRAVEIEKANYDIAVQNR